MCWMKKAVLNCVSVCKLWCRFRIIIVFTVHCSGFCFQSITKNRKHWSSQTLDDNVLMVRRWHSREIHSIVEKSVYLLASNWMFTSSLSRINTWYGIIIHELNWRRFCICCNMVFVCVVQPKLTDEEGWKRFCLGEKVYLGTSSCDTDAEPEPALDYRKVVWMCVCLKVSFTELFI